MKEFENFNLTWYSLVFTPGSSLNAMGLFLPLNHQSFIANVASLMCIMACGVC